MPPQAFCILMNVYEFFKFSSVRSVSQCGNTSGAVILHYIWPGWQGGRDNFHQLSKLTKIHFYNLTSLAYSNK